MSSLLRLLHQLPDLAILALVVVVLTGFAMAAPFIGQRLFRLPADEKRADAAFDAFKAVMAMTGVVLAFALVEANANLHAVQALVAKEAAAITAADRSLLRSGNPGLITLRPALAAYATSIVDDEWPLLATEARSGDTDDAYNALSKQARAVNPADARQQAMFSELLKALDDMADYREQRLVEGESDLPSFFWVTTGGLLAIGFGLALLTAATLHGIVSVGATTAAIALLVGFTIIVDQPFEGETSVTPKEIVKALQLNSRRG